MSIIASADTGADDLPEIANSLRFNGTNAYLSRTPASAGNQKTWVWRGVVKRTKLGVRSPLFAGGTSGTLFFADFDSTDKFGLSFPGVALNLSTEVYRDVTSWYDVVVACDTTQTTTANIIKVFINNTPVTITQTVLATNSNTSVNSATVHYIGQETWNPSISDCYMASVCFIDGYPTGVTNGNWNSTNFAALFGYTDPNGQWRSLSKAALTTLASAGGTNSFFLPFDNGSSTTTLGYDASSKGNNWTLTNMVRDGSVSDCWSYDTPTNNFATLNPLQIYNSAGGIVSTVAGNGSLDLPTVAAQRFGSSTIACSVGKWYAEFVCTVSTDAQVGAYPSPLSLGAPYYQASDTVSYNTNGAVWNPHPTQIQTYSSWTTGDVIGVALDMDSGKVWFSKNGSWQGGGSPSAGTSPAKSGLALTYTIGTAQGSSGACTSNFGQRPVSGGAFDSASGGYFRYTPPSGFKALCTKNLPTPTGAAAEPKKHFDVRTRTGTGSTYSVTDLLFQPDFLWSKCRSNAGWHDLVDAIRGVGNALSSNATNAEATGNSFVTSFNSNGYTLPANVVGDYLWTNVSGYTFVDWLFNMGGNTVTNTDGSITSQVRANPAAGFSIVTYTGNGAVGATVGHGLGVTPAMIITRVRNNTAFWPTYHKSANASPASGCMNLQSTAAFLSTSTPWNNVVPSSSVFTVSNSGAGNGYDTSLSANNYVAYCFAEVAGFSKIGSYTGNGSADGPFVWCGFRPKFVMWKNSSAVSNWAIEDSARSPSNQMQDYLLPNLSAAEGNASTVSFDFTANGFKVRGTDAGLNGSGNTIVFIAFAEAPFKYSGAK